MIIAELLEAVTARVPVVLATVVDSERSVPRRPGSKMLVYADGRISGSVGGGELESRVRSEALLLFETRQPARVSYELLDPSGGDPGLCGGTVELYLEPHLPQTTVIVVGDGELAAAVAELSEWVGYRAVTAGDADLHAAALDRFTVAVVLGGREPASGALTDSDVAFTLSAESGGATGTSTAQEQAVRILAEVIAHERTATAGSPAESGRQE